MPPYLVGARAEPRRRLARRTPTRTIYTSWEEFAKQLFWDYQLGEAFVLATAALRDRLAGPLPCRAAVDGQRRDAAAACAATGSASVDVTDDMLHIRYQSLDRRRARPRAAGGRRRPAGRRRGAGPLRARSSPPAAAIPPSILTAPRRARPPSRPPSCRPSGSQARDLDDRRAGRAVGRRDVAGDAGQPEGHGAGRAVAAHRERGSRCCSACRRSWSACPSGGDSMTYANVHAASSTTTGAPACARRPQTVMAALSGWLLPRGTRVEVNRDAYVQPEPLRAGADRADPAPDRRRRTATRR